MEEAGTLIDRQAKPRWAPRPKHRVGAGSKVPRGRARVPFLPASRPKPSPTTPPPPTLVQGALQARALGSPRPSRPQLWTLARARERALDDLHFHVDPELSPPPASTHAASRYAATASARLTAHRVAGSARRGARRDRRAACREPGGPGRRPQCSQTSVHFTLRGLKLLRDAWWKRKAALCCWKCSVS